MAEYKKNQVMGGTWVKAADLKNGTKAKLTTEVTPSPSRFKDKEGNTKMQDSAKIRFQGDNETYNVNINRATLEGFIDAFGEDSAEWVGKVLTVQTEKIAIAGKRVTALYLVPEGFVVEEDGEGYVHVIKEGSTDPKQKPRKTKGEEDTIEYPAEDINPEDIPF